jgi:hypothetical protein
MFYFQLFCLQLLCLYGLLLRHFAFIPVVLDISTYITVVFHTLFTLCPFETKRESIFNFGPRLYF